MRCRLLILLLVGLSQTGCDLFGGTTFTLYRSSVLDTAARIHVATFDARDGEAYNRENCEEAARLFSSQAGVRTRFWCEKGRYRV